jgi:predicted RNA binding protein YcfA (HicA-like mRNA interferase family)
MGNMNNSLQTSLKLVLEGTYTNINESISRQELDLKHEKWCACNNPNGFTFVTSEGNEQVWRHLKCGGLVVRPMHSKQDYGKS